MGQPVVSVNPRTGDVTEVSTQETDQAELDERCAASEKSLAALDELGPHGRAGLLRAMAAELSSDETDLVAVADRESGLGLPRLTGELARTSYQLRFFADVIEDGAYLELTIDHAGSTPAGPRPDLRRMLVPIGPVAVFEASNFPLAFGVPGGDTASALAAGCPVVVKAHPAHPETAERCINLLRAGARKAGVPDDVVQLVQGMHAGTALMLHPKIRAAAFTGSLRGGQALSELAMRRPDPIPFYGEYGSVNPVVVTTGAVTERGDQIAAGYAASFTAGAGQFCTKPGLLFTPAGAAGEALEKSLVDAVTAAAGGWLLTASIKDQYVAGLERLVNHPGVEVLARSADVPAAGFGAAPTVLKTSAEALAEQGTPLLDECFGPVSIVVEYRSEDELIGALNRLPGTLTATLHSAAQDGATARRVSDALVARSGRIVHNGYPTGVAVSWAIHHGGPWPATSSSLHTSVGASAVRRFLRPIAYQDAPEHLLPDYLREDNPRGLLRRVDGSLARV